MSAEKQDATEPSGLGQIAPCSPDALAKRLDVSLEAVELARSCELIDLHVESMIPMRLWGYDWTARHHGAPFGGRLFGHLDLPRAIDGGLSGAMWSISTNPLRTIAGRWQAFLRNVEAVRALTEASNGAVALVGNRAEYDACRRRGAVPLMLAIQGGNALEGAPDTLVRTIGDRLIRVTLVHLTSTAHGDTSSPLHWLRATRGLTHLGRDLVAQLNAARVFIDLAHASRRTFWDVVDVHDRSQPLIVTHTGVDGVRPSWRNLDNRQLKAIADTGGTIGVIYAAQFLRSQGGARDGGMVVDHMSHIIDVVGDEFVSVGSDYDGAITPPPDLRSGDSYPRLVQHMLDRGFSVPRIERILAGNFLRAFEHLRPT